MRIDGKALADAILTRLHTTCLHLKEKGITPTLGVILVGDDPRSLSYIRQKTRFADKGDTIAAATCLTKTI